MPYVDLFSSDSDDFASLWYTTNTTRSCVSSFDPDKPTVILLHPPFLDSTWMQVQMTDTRLSSNYNIIAFDLRTSGKSLSRPTGLHDAYVEAADLAFAHQILCLPPAHIFAVANQSVPLALRFAALFPEMCISLTLCAVPPPTELKHVFNALEEMFQSWCYAEDLESLEHAGKESVRFLAGPDFDNDFQDEMIAHWEVHYPPFRRSRMIQNMNVVMNRTNLKPAEYEAIQQPVLIIQGEYSEVYPVKYANNMKQALVNAETHVYVVRGGQGYMSIVPSYANLINQTFFKFLSRQRLVRSDLRPPEIPIHDRMRFALVRLAELMDDPSIAQRPLKSSLSFSCVTPEICRSQIDTVRIYGKDQATAFSPLGPNERPIRKYSERTQDHWFHGEGDGISYAGIGLGVENRQIRDRGSVGSDPRDLIVPQINLSEPISNEVAQDGRLRRAMYNSASISVDKHVIKGSMSKVMASTGVPLPRLMHGML